MERLSSIITQQRRLVLKNCKRHTRPNLPFRVQLHTRKMERSSSNCRWSAVDGGKSVDYCWECRTWVTYVALRWLQENRGRWREKRGQWRESFLTVYTLFQTMSTPLDTSYTFLSVCTWFQTMCTPLEKSYTFLTVCTWFQTMCTPLEMSYTFLTVCTWFQTMFTPL